jgi:hypothetical protein
VPLKHGDQVQIGPLVFEVVLEGATIDSTPLMATGRTETLSPVPPAADTTVRALDTEEMEAVNNPPPPAPDSAKTEIGNS